MGEKQPDPSHSDKIDNQLLGSRPSEAVQDGEACPSSDSKMPIIDCIDGNDPDPLVLQNPWLDGYLR